jgi:predicted acylesterase/phospholipase RssA
MAIYLQNVWLSITKTSQIYKYRFPLIYALFRAPSLIDNTPAYNLIQQYTGNPIKRNITVAATDISTGELINFNQTIGRENMTTACWASGAYPAAFPPIKIDERYFIDGCATSNLDGFVVVDWCRDMGFKDKDIVVDLYYDVHPNILVQERVNRTRETLARLTNIRHYYKSNWFISQLKTDFPDVEIRYEITPSAAIHNYPYIVPGDFQYKINLGYNDTILLLKKSKAQRQRDASERFLIDPHFR